MWRKLMKKNYGKYIVLAAVLALGVPTVHSTYQAHSEVKYDLVGEEVREITSISPISIQRRLGLSYGTKMEDLNFQELFRFRDQNGNEIDQNLLNIEYFEITSTSRGRLQPIENIFTHYRLQENGYNPAINVGYITATAELKSNPEISYRAPNAIYNGVTQIFGYNEYPTVKILENEPTMYEGDKYVEFSNVEFTDNEDDRDGRPLQTEVRYHFDKDNLKPGTYNIIYAATDSQGARSQAIKTLTVLPYQAPEIAAQTRTLTATSEAVDLLEVFDITAYDSIDGDVNDSLEIVDSNVNLKVEGDYTLTVRATNSNDRYREKKIDVRVRADAPTLEVGNLEIEQFETFNPFTDLEYSAIDSVDGDISHLVTITSDIDLSISGRQFLSLEIENSNGKKTTVVATVDVTEVEAPVEEEPEVEDELEDEEVVEVEDEELEEEEEPELEDEEDNSEIEKEPELKDEEAVEEVEEDEVETEEEELEEDVEDVEGEKEEELEVETEDTVEVEVEVEVELDKGLELDVEREELQTADESQVETTLKVEKAVVEGETTTTEKLIKEDSEVMRTENEEKELLQTGINHQVLQPLGAMLTGLSGFVLFKFKKK